jgi:hypothetical protein
MRKRCPGTKTQQPHTEDYAEFSDSTTRPDGKAAFCRHCAAEVQREWKRANPEKVKAARIAYAAKCKLKNLGG